MTEAGCEVVGIVPAPKPQALSASTPKAHRAGTKQATLVALLQREEGATLDEMVAATGWLSHTVRGALTGAIKKRLRLEVTSEKIGGRGRVYRVK